MAIEVLRRQDVLVGRIHLQASSGVFPAKDGRTSCCLHRNQKRTPYSKNDRRRSNIAAVDKKKSNGRRRKGGIGEGAPAVGQVTLLRRGESLASKIGDAKPRDPIHNTPPPRIHVSDTYAGYTFGSSPSPRCLPFPSFSKHERQRDHCRICSV